jgi:hypothetical protein
MTMNKFYAIPLEIEAWKIIDIGRASPIGEQKYYCEDFTVITLTNETRQPTEYLFSDSPGMYLVRYPWGKYQALGIAEFRYRFSEINWQQVANKPAHYSGLQSATHSIAEAAGVNAYRAQTMEEAMQKIKAFDEKCKQNGQKINEHRGWKD